MYFDNAREYLDAANQLGIIYGTRDANRPQSNGVAERAVRSILEGTRSVLFQSGLPHCYWAEAAECFAFSKKTYIAKFATPKTPLISGVSDTSLRARSFHSALLYDIYQRRTEN